MEKQILNVLKTRMSVYENLAKDNKLNEQQSKEYKILQDKIERLNSHIAKIDYVTNQIAENAKTLKLLKDQSTIFKVFIKTKRRVITNRYNYI
jgi:prefoldin subunit 5